MGKKIPVHEFLEIYSRKILEIGIPVIITLLIAAYLTRFKEQRAGAAFLNRSFTETLSTNSNGIPWDWSLYIALILIVMIVIVTAILLACYYYGCLKAIFVWMTVAVGLLLSYYVYLALGDTPKLLNIPADWLAVVFIAINLVIVGVLSIFWRSPPIVTQVFLIFISVLTSLVFLSIPDWTIWLLLVLLIIYDCIVVLCPMGLLNLLLKKSEERGDAIPALIYSTAAYTWEEKGTEEQNELELDDEEESISSSSSSEGNGMRLPEIQEPLNEEDERAPQQPNRDQIDPNPAPRDAEKPPEQQKKPPQKRKRKRKGKDDGIKLGLGDFVFYSILITRAARLGWDMVVICCLAVILGLSLTLLCLYIFNRPLPALPFSLALGIIFYIVGAMTFRPYAVNLRETTLVM